MYTVYVIFVVVLILSFVTGTFVLISERKNKKKRLILDKGKIIDSGTHEELLKRCKLYKKLYESELTLS